MSATSIAERAAQVIGQYRRLKRRIVTAESCTGGLLAGALTSIPGASAVLERGFITYSNESKVDLLGVEPDLLRDYGAVSLQVAEAMAQGALAYSLADAAVSVTGIAGPDGGSEIKPVGLVYFGLATREGLSLHLRCVFEGNRDSIRAQAVLQGLDLLASLDGREGEDIALPGRER